MKRAQNGKNGSTSLVRQVLNLMSRCQKNDSTSDMEHNDIDEQWYRKWMCRFKNKSLSSKGSRNGFIDMDSVRASTWINYRHQQAADFVTSWTQRALPTHSLPPCTLLQSMQLQANGGGPRLSVRTSLPSATRQTRAVPSADPVTTYSPSGVRQTEVTLPRCPSSVPTKALLLHPTARSSAIGKPSASRGAQPGTSAPLSSKATVQPAGPRHSRSKPASRNCDGVMPHPATSGARSCESTRRSPFA
eukprot:4775357-Pleurochrysis_carterae.AAC.3